MVEEGEDVTLPPAGQIYRTNNPGTLTVGPLPPTDVQRPTPRRRTMAGDIPSLTEEELATCKALAERCPASATPGHWDLAMHWTPRLIADLRASRERIAELEEWVANQFD